jgi:hypothetical protein
MNLNFSGMGKFLYTYNSTNTQGISTLNYYNIEFRGTATKIINTLTVNNILSTSNFSTSANSVKIKIGDQMSLGINMTFSLSATSNTFILDSKIGIADNRNSSNVFPGIWSVEYDPSLGGNISFLNTDYCEVPAGIFDNLILNEPASLSGNTEITGDFDISLSSQSTYNKMEFILNGKKLTLSGTITSLSGTTNHIRGDNLAELIISNSNGPVGTIYFSDTAGQDIINKLTINNGSNLILGSNSTKNFVVKSALTLDNGTLTIGDNTLELQGTITTSNSGALLGSVASGVALSKLKCNNGLTSTYYFGQTSDEEHTLSNLLLSSGSSFTMGSDLILNNANDALNFNGNSLSINNNTLTITGVINYGASSAGRLKGSSNSNLFVLSENDLYFDQTTNENRTLKDLTIGGSGITVTLQNWLNITGGTSTTGYGIVDVIAASNKLYTKGYLTLKSNEYGTAMIGANPGTVAFDASGNTGTLLVENYIPYLNRGRQYRFLASPVSGGVFLQWRDSLNSRTGRGTHITGKQAGSAANDFDESTTNHPSAFLYDETKAGSVTGIGTNSGAAEDAGWVRFSQANSNTIENGKGYRILIRGDRTIDLTSSGSNFSPNNTTIQTRGGYVAGPTDVTITNSGSNANNGINLIGNPYACAIDWNEIYTTCSTTTGSTNVDPVYAVFDPSMQSYQSYSANASTPGPMQYISPGQGFLVYTSSASQKVLFPTSCKVTSDAGARVFSTIKTNHLVTYLRKDSATADRTIIYFVPGATNFYDKYDAGHIQNGKVNLSSLDSSNILYNINCLDSLSSSRIVSLSLYGTPLGTYFMSFEDINTFRNHDVYLIDNYLKKTTKVDENTQYQIDVTTDKFSYAEGRLAISFEPKPLTNLLTVNKTDIFNISPNPVKDQLIVKMDNQQMGPIEFEILNVSGQTILGGKLDSLETKINTSNLMTGIYFINLRANNQTQTIKFIK